MLYEPELQATTELLVMWFLPQHVQYTVSFFVTLLPLPMQGVWEVTGKTQGLVCGPCLLIFHQLPEGTLVLRRQLEFVSEWLEG